MKSHGFQEEFCKSPPDILTVLKAAFYPKLNAGLWKPPTSDESYDYLCADLPSQLPIKLLV